MKNVTVVGMYLGKGDCFGRTDGGTAYGNLLEYPAMLSRSLLEKRGLRFFSEEELPPEKADIVFCIDLTPELWERIKRLPGHIRKILQSCESAIYARYSHCVEILADPLWDVVLTWNRSYEAPYLIHYDIPVTGKSVSEPLSVQMDAERFSRGVVISSFKMGDCRGMVPQRDSLYKFLSGKGEIDLYGNNWKYNPPEHTFGKVDNKLKIMQKYQYALVIENSWAPGYVTEKIPDCILAGLPVIYWGDVPNAQRRFPDTFVPLEEITYEAFCKARNRLMDQYPCFRSNVMREREKSDHWCDSYLKAIAEGFDRIAG